MWGWPHVVAVLWKIQQQSCGLHGALGQVSRVRLLQLLIDLRNGSGLSRTPLLTQQHAPNLKMHICFRQLSLAR